MRGAIVLVIFATACSGSTVTNNTNTTAPTTQARGATAETTTSQAPASSVTTTTAAPTTTTAAGSLPTLEDGRPATFLAVTTDFEAVEVDTVTGEVIRSFGQMSDAAEVEADSLQIVIDSLWRSGDGSRIIISECCEPAGGTIHYLDPGQTLTPETHDDSLGSSGWFVAPSPVSSDELAVLGYQLVVGDLEAPRYSQSIDQGPEGFPSGIPAWSRDGGAVYWLAETGGMWLLNTLDLSQEPPTIESTLLPWVAEGARLEGVVTQASGNLVAFSTDNDSGEVEGVVLAPNGQFVASFKVEDGARLGSYDPSGTYLIYTDGDYNARWQGGGNSAVLGEGFLFASW